MICPAPPLNKPGDPGWQCTVADLQWAGADDHQIGATFLQPAPGTRGCGCPRTSLVTRGCWWLLAELPSCPAGSICCNSQGAPLGALVCWGLALSRPIPPAHPGEKWEAATPLGQSTRVPWLVPAVSFSHFPSMRAAGLPALLRSAPAILSSVSPAPAMHFLSPFDISPLLRHSPWAVLGLGFTWTCCSRLLLQSRARAEPCRQGPLVLGSTRNNPARTDKRSAEQARARKLSLHQQP